MQVRSTRGGTTAPLLNALEEGLAPDGGLYLPVSGPVLPSPPRTLGDRVADTASWAAPILLEGLLPRAELEAVAREALDFPVPLTRLAPRRPGGGPVPGRTRVRGAAPAVHHAGRKRGGHRRGRALRPLSGAGQGRSGGRPRAGGVRAHLRKLHQPLRTPSTARATPSWSSPRMKEHTASRNPSGLSVITE